MDHAQRISRAVYKLGTARNHPQPNFLPCNSHAPLRCQYPPESSHLTSANCLHHVQLRKRCRRSRIRHIHWVHPVPFHYPQCSLCHRQTPARHLRLVSLRLRPRAASIRNNNLGLSGRLRRRSWQPRLRKPRILRADYWHPRTPARFIPHRPHFYQQVCVQGHLDVRRSRRIYQASVKPRQHLDIPPHAVAHQHVHSASPGATAAAAAATADGLSRDYRH